MVQTLASKLTSVHMLVSLEGNPALLEQLITADPVFRAFCEARGLKIVRASIMPQSEEEAGMDRLHSLIRDMERLVHSHPGTIQAVSNGSRAALPSVSRTVAVVPTTAGRLEDNAPIRKKLRRYFQAHPDVSQGQFADRIKLGRSTVSAFLNGRDLAGFSLEKIARELKD